MTVFVHDAVQTAIHMQLQYVYTDTHVLSENISFTLLTQSNIICVPILKEATMLRSRGCGRLYFRTQPTNRPAGT